MCVLASHPGSHFLTSIPFEFFGVTCLGMLDMIPSCQAHLLLFHQQDIIEVVRCAACAIEELSKESPSEQVVNSKTTRFLKMLEDIEKRLSEQISYLSQVTTSQQHEGSIYALEKSFDLAVWKTQFVKAKMAEIKKLSQK